MARPHVLHEAGNGEGVAGEPLDHVGAANQRRAVAQRGKVRESVRESTKQLVSCWKPPIAMRAMTSSPLVPGRLRRGHNAVLCSPPNGEADGRWRQ